MTSTVLPAVYVEGVAFWTARLPGWDAARGVMRGECLPEAPTAARPAPALLAPTERRRAPDTVAVALEVAARACEAAGRNPASLASVFASTHGDLAISDYMCTTLVDTPTLISPTKFHNSVHNAAAGYWSMGTKSQAPYTAISAYHYTFGIGLLEAAAQALCEQRPVLYAAFDIEARGALATMAPSRGLLGAALVLGVEPPGRPVPRLFLRMEHCDAVVPTAAQSPAAPLVQDNALAPCLPLFEALAQDGPAQLAFALGEHAQLNVDVRQERVS